MLNLGEKKKHLVASAVAVEIPKRSTAARWLTVRSISWKFSVELTLLALPELMKSQNKTEAQSEAIDAANKDVFRSVYLGRPLAARIVSRLGPFER